MLLQLFDISRHRVDVVLNRLSHTVSTQLFEVENLARLLGLYFWLICLILVRRIVHDPRAQFISTHHTALLSKVDRLVVCLIVHEIEAQLVCILPTEHTGVSFAPI